MLHYYYLYHIYLPNINYPMKSLMCTRLTASHTIASQMLSMFNIGPM